MKYESQTKRSSSFPASGVIVLLMILVMIVLLLQTYPWLRQLNPIAPALIVSGAFALLARALRAVSTSGALAGALVSFLLYAFAGLGAFAALVAVFVLTWSSTRLGYARKLNLGKAESRAGRNAAQVLANLGIAALCAAAIPLAGFSTRAPSGSAGPLLLALASALAEAAADTVSSECGEAWSDDVRLITTWKLVSPGTDGGLSLPGTLAGVVAAVTVAGVCAAVHLIAASAFPIPAAAAVLGMVFDSVLGATLERRQLLGNNGVNFSSTAFAALAAVAMSLLVR